MFPTIYVIDNAGGSEAVSEEVSLPSYPPSLFSSASAAGTIVITKDDDSSLSHRPVITGRKPSKRRQVAKQMQPYAAAIKDVRTAKRRNHMLAALPSLTSSSTVAQQRSGLGLMFTSDELEDYFDIERAEMEAARKIQRW